MTSILDRVAAKPFRTSYRPSSVREFLIFRLAQKLGEPAAYQHYIELASGHSVETLRLAYRRASKKNIAARDLARAFHDELAYAKGQGGRDRMDRLAAIKVERRCVAVAVFVGGNLDFHDRRVLSAQADKADASAVGFLKWVITNFDIESAALERMTNGNEIRRASLNRVILDMLRSGGVPVWEIAKREMLEAYGHPPLGTRVELRSAAQTILWSMFNSDTPDSREIDAAALGLYIQTERQFYIP